MFSLTGKFLSPLRLKTTTSHKTRLESETAFSYIGLDWGRLQKFGSFGSALIKSYKKKEQSFVSFPTNLSSVWNGTEKMLLICIDEMHGKESNQKPISFEWRSSVP